MKLTRLILEAAALLLICYCAFLVCFVFAGGK